MHRQPVRQGVVLPVAQQHYFTHCHTRGMGAGSVPHEATLKVFQLDTRQKKGGRPFLGNGSYLYADLARMSNTN
jgi:hypothetical protein